MRTILVTAYAVNPYKGSEDGMGWNFICQIAVYQNVIAVTRINNGPAIRKYMAEHPENAGLYARIRFIYFDWPKWMILWKKGPLLSMIYYYGWQFTLACWLRRKKIQADIVHNLNFHNDWTPTFLWLLKKPLVWGPVGHHRPVKKEMILPVYGRRAWLKDRLLWKMKQFFWRCDPFLRIAARRSSVILGMNTESLNRLPEGNYRKFIMPSVACEDVATPSGSNDGGFHVLSIGRLVPLKGFDLTIHAFASFYYGLPAPERKDARLLIIGDGPEKTVLQKIAADSGIAHCTEFIAWMARKDLLELYRQAKVFLFPSHEGAGMVVAEAMSRGIPVVCLANEGPGELVARSSALKAGLTDYRTTIADLAQKLKRLYADPTFYCTEKELALRQFQTSLSWNGRSTRLRDIYSTIKK